MPPGRGELRRRQRGRWWPAAARRWCMLQLHCQPPFALQPLARELDPACSRLGHHGCTHRPHPRHDLAEHQLHPGPVLSRESRLPRCFPPSDGSRDLRGKQLESLGQAVTHTGRRRRKLGWLSYYKGHLVQVKCCLSSRKSFPVFGE